MPWVLAALLVSEARASSPPGAELADLETVAPHVRLDLRYATANNFTQERIYPVAKCYLRREVAERLARVQAALEAAHLGLKVFDCYRPLSVQRRLWSLVPDERYVADPAKGSRHNRAAAVDVTLVDAQGAELEMPTAFDDFSEKAHRGYLQLPPAAIAHRARLEEAMKAEGFVGLATEWWHFDGAGAQEYPLLDLDFDLVAPLPPGTRQLVVVVAPDWSSHEATMTRFERDARGAWRPVGAALKVVTGRGMGWGLGLHPASLAKRLGGPVKKEGDRRSPAGMFRLGELTGYAAEPPPGATLPYRQATSRLYCVDDAAAPEYNRLALLPERGAPRWKSTEPMRRGDALYTRTVFVAHNPQATPGAGSCIFLHVWRGEGSPTVGCTALPLDRLEELMSWLRARDEPVLLQFPASVWQTLAPGWGLAAGERENLYRQ